MTESAMGPRLYWRFRSTELHTPLAVQRGRREAGELAHVVDHVRLVVEAGVERQSRPVRLRLTVRGGDDAIQPHDALGVLGRQSGGGNHRAAQLSLRHLEVPP